MNSQSGVSPVKPRRLLSIPRDPLARGFEQRSRRGGVESGIVARRQVELAARSTSVVSIIIDESPGHEQRGDRRQEAENREGRTLRLLDYRPPRNATR